MEMYCIFNKSDTCVWSNTCFFYFAFPEPKDTEYSCTQEKEEVQKRICHNGINFWSSTLGCARSSPLVRPLHIFQLSNAHLSALLKVRKSGEVGIRCFRFVRRCALGSQFVNDGNEEPSRAKLWRLFWASIENILGSWYWRLWAIATT